MENKLSYRSLLYFSIIFLNSCFEPNHCVDNLKQHNENIPYYNQQILEFSNDTLGKRYDTVSVRFSKLENERYSKSAEAGYGYDECEDQVYYKMTNKFSVSFSQADNEGGNYPDTAFFGNKIFKRDSLYQFNNELKEAHYYHIRLDIDNILNNLSKDHDDNYVESARRYNIRLISNYNNHDSTFMYNDFVVINHPYYELLEYRTYHVNGEIRTWKIVQEE